MDLSGNVSELYNRILEIGETVAASKPILGTPIYQKGDRVCFHNQGNCYCGTIVGIYPWGKSDVKDQAVYDISLDDQQTIIHYVKEEDSNKIFNAKNDTVSNQALYAILNSDSSLSYKILDSYAKKLDIKFNDKDTKKKFDNYVKTPQFTKKKKSLTCS